MASGCRLRQLLVYWPWTPIWALFLMTHFIVVGAKTPATKLAIVWFFTWKIKEIILITWVLIPIKSGFFDRIFFSAVDQIILIFLNAESLLSYSARILQDTKLQTIYVSFRQWYFVTKIVLTYCEKKILIVIDKNFWNSRLKAKNLQNFWDH